VRVRPSCTRTSLQSLGRALPLRPHLVQRPRIRWMSIRDLQEKQNRSAPSPRSGTSESIPRESGRDDENEPGSQSEQARGAGDRQEQRLDSACAGESSASFRKQNGSYEIRFLYQKMRRSAIRLYQRRRTRTQSPRQVGGIRRTRRVTTTHVC
jgi:hypothetical protein